LVYRGSAHALKVFLEIRRSMKLTSEGKFDEVQRAFAPFHVAGCAKSAPSMASAFPTSPRRQATAKN
jgi:hypothetical protein